MRLSKLSSLIACAISELIVLNNVLTEAKEDQSLRLHIETKGVESLPVSQQPWTTSHETWDFHMRWLS